MTFTDLLSFYPSDRHQLVQQIQMIGGGALGQPAATAVRHIAAQNGVWSLGNFGGVPPKSAMMYHQPAMASGVSSDPNAQQQAAQSDGAILPNKLEDPDYRYVFNSSTVGMVSHTFTVLDFSDIDSLQFFRYSGHCVNGRGVY